MHGMEIDIEQGRLASGKAYYVSIPELFEECAGHEIRG
jgi:hypothetical protein